MTVQVDLLVDGMSCEGCESSIAFALTSLDGVERVEADHATGQVTVLHDPDQISVDAIRTTVADIGYELRP